MRLVGTDRLNVDQLSQVKKQIEEELEHLTTSYAQLQGAQIKFKECLGAVQLPSISNGGLLLASFPLSSTLTS